MQVISVVINELLAINLNLASERVEVKYRFNLNLNYSLYKKKEELN